MKSSLRFHLTPARIAVTKKINDNKCWHGCGERGPRYSLLVGVQTGAAAVGSSMESCQKLNKELRCNPDRALLGVYPERLKLDHRNTCTFMFIATLFTITKKSGTSLDGHQQPMEREIVICVPNGILFGYKEK